MEEADVSSYWCHMCLQTVDPIMEIEAIKCPICLSGFVEEMAPASTQEHEPPPDFGLGGPEPERGASLWPPILLDMANNQQRIRHHRFRRYQEYEDEESLDHELGVLMRTRRNSTAALLHLLQRVCTESENSDTNDVLVDPINRAIIVQASYDPSGESSINRAPLGPLGDYFVGPGLETLLQHLAENDPNRYGTPPAKKEAVEALANVTVEETCQCSVCLDELEVGVEVKEMPCKHKFHSECILHWLELHSCCPVCRYQLPFDESKIGSEESRNNSNTSSEENDNDNGRRFSVPLPWPFSSLFSPSGSQSGNGNSSSASHPGPSSDIMEPDFV